MESEVTEAVIHNESIQAWFASVYIKLLLLSLSTDSILLF